MMKKFIALAAAIVVSLSTSSCRDAEEIRDSRSSGSKYFSKKSK